MTNISIVVPCYNGWRYMEKCLSSFEKQTRQPYEIIIADDCSTDDSYEKVEEYIKTSSLNIVHIKSDKNSGPGITRKKAVEKSTGSYLAFCDCDDWYEPNLVERVASIIEISDPDLVMYDNYIAYDTRRTVAHVATSLIGKDKSYILANYPMSLSRLIVKRKLLEGVVFPPLYNGEDGAVVPQIIANAESVEIVDEPLYNYYFREGSASNKPSRSAYLNLIEAFSTVELIRDRFPIECEFLGIKMVCYGATLNAFKTGATNADIKAIIAIFTTTYPNWCENKYFPEYSKVKRLYLKLIQRNWFFLARQMARMHYAYTKTLSNKV